MSRNGALTDGLARRVARNLETIAAQDRARRERIARAAALDPLDYRALHPADDSPGRAIDPHQTTMTDANGQPGAPGRWHDTLDHLARNLSIEGPELDAGRQFQRDFHLAGLQSLRAAPLVRSARCTATSGDRADPGEAARRRIGIALDALGGPGSPIGAAAWTVLGLDMNVKEFAAATQLGGGRSLDQRVAKGLLIGALAVLAFHYGTKRT